MVWYATDYVESTNSSSQALDARLIDNEGPGAGPSFGALKFLRVGAQRLARSKSEGQFLLVSMAESGTTCQIEAAAELTFLPYVPGVHEQLIHKCARCQQIPQMMGWCPMTLMDVSLITNFYNQRALEALYSEGAHDPAVDFPNAIYLDAVDAGGLIRTGTQLINPLPLTEGGGAAGPTKHATDGFAYTATLVGANIRRLCRRQSPSPSACSSLLAAVEAARAQHPVRLWDDPEHGRLADWPPLPTRVESLLV